MKKNILVLLLFLFVTPLSFATSPQQINMKDLNDNIENLTRVIKNFELQMTELVEEKDKIYSAYKKTCYFCIIDYKSDGSQQLYDRYREKSLEISNLSQRISELRTKVMLLNNQLLAKKRGRKAMLDQLEERADLAYLNSKVLTLRAKTQDFEQLEKDFEAKIDREMIGNYIKDKLAKMMSSSLMCDVQKRCDDPQRAEIEGETIRKILFKKGPLARESYYDQTNSRRKK